MILSKKEIAFLYFALFLVYISGLFIPVMENDSAQHATMAMRMFVENDFLHIYKGTKDYLDKPHMHFWLAALSYKIFGIHEWSYRLPTLLFTLIGAFCTNKLAIHFYGKKVNHIASFIFLSAQAVILANHDVRTDGVLTGAIAISICYFVRYVDTNKLLYLLVGFLGLAIGFSSKGQLAVFVSVVLMLVHVAHTRKWNAVFSWKVLVGLLTFTVLISPVLYAYYVQFDLHPEKIINGRNQVSGIKFILWDQSFNRLTANGFNNNSPDYLFFFHTILWAFLPWSLLMYAGMYLDIKTSICNKFKKNPGVQWITSLGVLLVLLVISTSKFKLPHYLNGLFSVMAVLVTGYLVQLQENKKTVLLRRWANFQTGLVIFLWLFVVVLTCWAFPELPVYMIAGTVVMLTVLWMLYRQVQQLSLRKIVVISVGFMAMINWVLNIHFYPNLLQYQSGIVASKILKKHQVASSNIFVANGLEAWSVSFYAHKNLKELSTQEIIEKTQQEDWVYLDENRLKTSVRNGVKWAEIYPLNHYRITRLKFKFLNPKSREATLQKRYLVKR